MEGEAPGNAGSQDMVSVELPAQLVARISKRLPQSDFKTVGEYVRFVVEQVLTEVEEKKEDVSKPSENVFSKEDQASVEERLRDLGYL